MNICMDMFVLCIQICIRMVLQAFKQISLNKFYFNKANLIKQILFSKIRFVFNV